MELSYSHTNSQRILRQRNILAVAAAALGALTLLLFTVSLSRDREVVLQPVLRSPLTISAAGVSRDYLEMITRDTVVLTLDRSPQNLEYWMNAVLDIAEVRERRARSRPTCSRSSMSSAARRSLSSSPSRRWRSIPRTSVRR